MATLIFHSMAGSAYLWTAMMAADEKGVDYELSDLVLGSEAHLRLHPFGKMPVMQHGEVILYETQAITHYIDRAFDGPAPPTGRRPGPSPGPALDQPSQRLCIPGHEPLHEGAPGAPGLGV